MPPRRPHQNLPQQQHGHQVHSAPPGPLPGCERSGKTSPSKLHPGCGSADDLTTRILLGQQQQQPRRRQQGNLASPVTPASSPAPELEAALGEQVPPQTPFVTEADVQGSTAKLALRPLGDGAASLAAGTLSAPVSRNASDTQPEAFIRPGRCTAEKAAPAAASGSGVMVRGNDDVTALCCPGETPPLIDRVAVWQSPWLPRGLGGDWRPPVAPPPATPMEEELVTHGSPIEGIVASSPPVGSLVARFSPQQQAASVVVPSPCMDGSDDVVRGADVSKKDACHGLSAEATLRPLSVMVWDLAARLLNPVWEVVRARPLLAVAATPAAVLLVANMLLELLLLPLLAVPGMLVSFTISFTVAAVVSLSYHRNRAAAEHRHAVQALFYNAGTQLPATVQGSAASAAFAPGMSAGTGAALPAAIASPTPIASSSTLTLVDDAGLAALRELFGGGPLPAWLADARHGERAEWANALLARVWPSVEGPLRDIASPAIRAQADLAKPPFIRSVDLADLSLGSKPPRVEAIRLRPLASAAAQLEAAAAVAAAVAQTDTTTAAGGPTETRYGVVVAEETTLSCDARPAAAPAAPSVAAASVSSSTGTDAAAVTAQTVGADASKQMTGMMLSGVPDAAMAAVAASVAVQEHVSSGGAGAAVATAPGASDAKKVSVSAAAAGVEAIEVELDFRWLGDLTIGLFVEAYFSPGGGTVRLTPRLRELAAAGTVRLVLTPLVPYPPGFGAIQVSIPRAPQLAFAFDLGPTLGSAGGVAGAVASFLQPLVQDVLAEALVWPNRVVLPLLPEPLTGPLTELQLRTRGLLAVRLLAARGPPRGFKGTDREALKEGDQIELVAFTRPDRRVISPPATCHYGDAVPPPSEHVAAAVTPAADMPSFTWDLAGGGGGGSDSAPLLLYFPVQEPRSDVLRFHMDQLEGFKLGELLQPNLIRGVRQAWSSRRPLGRVAVPLAPLCAEPGVSFTAWLPLKLPGDIPTMDDPLAAAERPGPYEAEVHQGRVAGWPQLEGEGEGRGGLNATDSGGGGAAEGGFGAAGHQAIWAVPPGVAQPPIAAAAGEPPKPLEPSPPPGRGRAHGGAVLISMSYLSLDVLAERLEAAVTESLRTTGELPFVRGLLLIDVVSARWLLGPDAYGPREMPTKATATMYDKNTAPATVAEYGDGEGRDDEEESEFSDEDEGDEEFHETAGAEPLQQQQQQQRQRQVEVEAAVEAAARIIAADAPLTFGSVGPDTGSMHSNPAAARVLGSAAHMGDPAAAGGLALRNRHGRIRCDPYVQIQVTRPVLAPRLATAAEAAASIAQLITPSGRGSGGAAATAGGGVSPYLQRGSPVPSSVDPTFNLHGEVDDVIPAADGCELRVQVWHRRWFRRPKPLGQAVLPLRRLLETHGSVAEAAARAPGTAAAASPAPAANRSSADSAGGVRTGDTDSLTSISAARMEGWMRLRGKGARGGEVKVRVQFLPYLLS